METALNQYLSLDEDVSLFLQPLAGKVIAIHVQPFGLTLFLCPSNDTIQLLESYPGTPDTTLTGTAMALGLMGLSSKPMRSIFSGDVKIEGDTRIGRKFQELFDKLDVDLEEQLSHVTGDIIAHKIGRLFRAGQSWGKDSIETLKLNTAEFLQDETRDLPATPEIDIFFRQVDDTRTAYDRLQSRINRLQLALREPSDA